eukprot:7593458-Pyramimonas_sp.AAC.1
MTGAALSLHISSVAEGERELSHLEELRLARGNLKEGAEVLERFRELPRGAPLEAEEPVDCPEAVVGIPRVVQLAHLWGGFKARGGGFKVRGGESKVRGGGFK